MSYRDLKKFRNNRKQLMLRGFDNKCQICGYNKCDSALEFHHLDPSQKEFGLCQTLNIKWNAIKEELKKCICVCANCHREIHEGLIELDTSKQYFNEKLVEGYDPLHKSEVFYDICPICGQQKLKSKKYCSHKCACKARKPKLNWEKYPNLVEIIDNKEMSIHQIAKDLDVSWNGVKKRYIKLKKLLTN